MLTSVNKKIDLLFESYEMLFILFSDFGRFLEVFDMQSGRISMNCFDFGTVFTDFGTLSLIYDEIAMKLDQFHSFWTISMRFWNMIADLR